ncbi:hypothetical protein, partial [Salmonella enterica]|uniref:hypothetical protein n=1 Tax=Salmonella enterica TaxID=28901 RepID=UPI00352615C0
AIDGRLTYGWRSSSARERASERAPGANAPGAREHQEHLFVVRAFAHEHQEHPFFSPWLSFFFVIFCARVNRILGDLLTFHNVLGPYVLILVMAKSL